MGLRLDGFSDRAAKPQIDSGRRSPRQRTSAFAAPHAQRSEPKASDNNGLLGRRRSLKAVIVGLGCRLPVLPVERADLDGG